MQPLGEAGEGGVCGGEECHELNALADEGEGLLDVQAMGGHDGELCGYACLDPAEQTGSFASGMSGGLR